MRLTTHLGFLFFVLLPLFSLAQDAASSVYYKAEAIAIEADSQLKAGEIKKADIRIRESIKMYPTKAVYEYAKSLCRISDVKTANEIMDLAYNQLDKIGSNSIFTLDTYAKLVDGKWTGTLIETTLPRAKFLFGNDSYLLNKEFGSYQRNIQILETLILLDIKNTGGTFSFDFEYTQKENFKWQLSLAKKDYSTAISQLNQIPKSSVFTNNYRNLLLSNAYFEAGDFENSLLYNEKLSGIYSSSKNIQKFMVYASTGKNDEALLHLQKYNDDIKKLKFKSFKTNGMFYYLSIIDLNKKNYQNALVNLDSTLNHRTSELGSFAVNGLMDRWKVYKLIGDAYAGLEHYEKAKDHYNLSLLLYPEYEPAQKALLQLGSQVAVVLETDKTPPPIIITEPVTNRGLEIVSNGNDILVKGTAADPSGLKAVTINGLAVYVQTDGNFWGNVALKAGVNKIIVIATDGAGNASEHTFDIEKKSAIANSAIVPVVVKEGKNYCLLIGAQNYEDINIPSLENPIQDAVRLKLILKKDYDFEDGTIFSLFNPSANDVKRQLLELTNVIQPEDNLLIFYAGHGIWVEKEKKGYWLLVDAKRNDSATWLQNKDVLNLIAKLSSRHTLLITDACFSGGVFKTRSIGKDASAALKTMNEKISRVAITSGNDTEVPDESVFMKYLIKALTDNKEKYLTAQKMFINQIMEAVMTETKTEPRYGTLELAGHIGGDYIFAKK